MEVTISRLPDSELEALEDYMERQEIDPDKLQVLKKLLFGYGAAWDALEEMETIQDGSIGHTA